MLVTGEMGTGKERIARLIRALDAREGKRELVLLDCTTVHMPPLRDRTEDSVPPFRHFLAQTRPGQAAPELDEPVREYLLRRAYPGNVRNLKQLAARIAYRHVGPGPVTLGDLPPDERPALECEGAWPDGDFETSIRRALAQGIGLKDIGRLASETAIRVVVSAEEGNLQRAAQRLGVTDRALQMRKAQHQGAAPPPPPSLIRLRRIRPSAGVSFDPSPIGMCPGESGRARKLASAKAGCPREHAHTGTRAAIEGSR